jgi:hypothetical protein
VGFSHARQANHGLPGAAFARNQTEKDFTAAPRAACAETVRLPSTSSSREPAERSSPKPAKDAEKKSLFSSAASAVKFFEELRL